MFKWNKSKLDKGEEFCGGSSPDCPMDNGVFQIYNNDTLLKENVDYKFIEEPNRTGYIIKIKDGDNYFETLSFKLNLDNSNNSLSNFEFYFDKQLIPTPWKAFTKKQKLFSSDPDPVLVIQDNRTKEDKCTYKFELI